MAGPGAPLSSPPNKSQRFLTNVFWNWSGVALNLAVAILLNPYIIRKLGPEQYGIWALIFTVIDYLTLFDLGLNTAITNFCARYWAGRETEKINEVINTALFYFSIISLLVMALAVGLAHGLRTFFRISPSYQAEFTTMLQITGVTWAICILMNMFASALHGFHRFDLESRVWVVTLLLRSAGYLLVLRLGHGLVAMAAVFVLFQVMGSFWNVHNFRTLFTGFRLSKKLVKLSVFREILSYGLKSFFANTATLVLYQSGPVVIGHYEPTEYVGFYTLPSRILQYASDAITRVANVTRASAAELTAMGKPEIVLKLGIYSNRYSLTLFMPLAVLLLLYGRELILRWVGPVFATYSAPLLPVFLLSTSLVLAGQFNSSALLYGISGHGGYARGVIVEAVLNVTGMFLVIPRYGIMGAAVVSSSLMLLIRGIYTPLLVSRNLRCSFLDYMLRIYIRPILTSVPILLLAWVLKTRYLPGRTWFDLVSAAVLIGLSYASLALFTCIEREHRGLLLSRIPFIGPRLAAALA